MEKIVALLFFLVCSIQCAGSVVTDKEYAHLPPVFELENFDRCMLLEDEALYCYMEFHVKPLDYTNTSITWQKIEELNRNPRNYHHDNLRHGICVPFTCPSIKISHKDPKFKEVLAECYSKKYENLGLYGTIEVMNCQTNELKKFDFLDYAALTFFIAYALLVIYASFYEGLARYKTPEEYKLTTTGTKTGRILTCFSIPYNWTRFISKKNDADTEALKPMQGVRFYNYSAVTLCHVSMGTLFSFVSNTKWTEKMSEKFAAILIACGPFALQTNLIMSSWLLTYYIFKYFDGKSGKKLNLKTIFVISFNRFLRLVTPLSIIILFQCTLLYHVGRSPIWESIIGREKQFCRENGWTNLLFVNNIINSDRMCFLESWYMAVDMHSFLLVLAILYFTVEKPERLWWIVPSTWLITKVIQAKRLSDMNIDSFLQVYPEQIYLFRGLYDLDDVWQYTILDDLTHTGGTLVGVIAGYLFYKYKDQQVFTKTIHIVLWWVFTYGMCLSVIIFPGMWFFSENYYPNKLFSLTYFALSPALFSIGIALGIFGLSQNVGWVSCWVTKWNPTYFLGKLTYSALLTHLPYIYYKKSNSRKLEYLNDASIFFETLEVFVVSLMLGLILCVTVEFPTSAIQNLFLKNKNENEIIQSDGEKQKNS